MISSRSLAYPEAMVELDPFGAVLNTLPHQLEIRPSQKSYSFNI